MVLDYSSSSLTLYITSYLAHHLESTVCTRTRNDDLTLFETRVTNSSHHSPDNFPGLFSLFSSTEFNVKVESSEYTPTLNPRVPLSSYELMYAAMQWVQMITYGTLITREGLMVQTLYLIEYSLEKQRLRRCG